MTDPYVGKLTFFRVYSGTMTSGSYVKNSTKGKRERVGRLLQMHANSRQEIDTVYSGDIAAAVGLKDTGTGDTLCGEKNDIILESMEFPEPVIHLSVEPKSKADQDKMTQALLNYKKKTQHSMHTDEETGQVIIGGMGELHRHLSRPYEEFNVECNVGAPMVSYRETFKSSAQVQGKFSLSTVVNVECNVGEWFHIVKHSNHLHKFKKLVNLVVVVNTVMFEFTNETGAVSNSKTLWFLVNTFHQ